MHTPISRSLSSWGNSSTSTHGSHQCGVASRKACRWFARLISIRDIRLTHTYAYVYPQDSLVLVFERIGEEVFVRSSPHMGESYPLSARRICWPPPPHAQYRDSVPALPVTDRPAILPLQKWKNYQEVKVIPLTVCTIYALYSHAAHVLTGESN